MLAGDPALDCFREECFAPVVCIAPFDNEADAITKANASAYALGAERCRSLSVKSFSVRSAEPKQQESQPPREPAVAFSFSPRTEQDFEDSESSKSSSRFIIAAATMSSKAQKPSAATRRKTEGQTSAVVEDENAMWGSVPCAGAAKRWLCGSNNRKTVAARDLE